jgi:hypothetical protein
MSIPHGVDSSGHYHPLLVDTTGRPLIVIDTLTGLTFTVTPDAAAEWTVKPEAAATWEVAQDTAADLNAAIHGYDGSAWCKQGMIWAYKSQLGVQTSHTGTAGTDQYDCSASVSAGEIWAVTHLASVDSTTAPTRIRIFAKIGGALFSLREVTAPGADNRVFWDGWIPLAAGNTITTVVEGVLLNDVLTLDVIGYKMGIAM